MVSLCKPIAVGKCINSLFKRKIAKTAVFNKMKEFSFDRIYEYSPHLSYRDNMTKKISKTIYEKDITAENLMYRLILDDENAKTRKTVYKIVLCDPRNTKSFKSLDAQTSEHIAKHVTNFNVSNLFGIQGSHFRSFFENLNQFIKDSKGHHRINVTKYINQFVEDNKFSKVLLRKNKDNTLKLVFKRSGDAPIVINNLKITDIPGTSDIASCSYTCNGKNYIKTVCKDSTLNKIISKLKTSDIEILEDGTREGEGFFRTMSNHQPNYFFLCDSTLFPVEESTMLNRLGVSTIDPIEVPMLSLMS